MPSTSYTYPPPYAHCSKQECDERQELKQVSALESTVETSGLPQHQRLLDPRLAVTKYRRSAAGSKVQELRSHAALRSTLHQLMWVVMHQAPTPYHSHISLSTTAEFCVDRFRACQADATRVSATDPVTTTWHVQFVRSLILLKYLLQGSTHYNLYEMTMTKLIWTAFDDYWVAAENRNSNNHHEYDNEHDDEILTLAAISHLSNCILKPEAHSTGWILWQFQKHGRGSVSDIMEYYPQWRQVALPGASLVVRQEYTNLLKLPLLSTLQKCCLAPCLHHLHYQALLQYNTGFAKQEAVKDMDLLLQDATILEDCAVWGLPVVEDRETGKLVLVRMKAAPMSNETMPPLRRHDEWVGFPSGTADQDGVSIPSSEWMQPLLFHRKVEK